MGPVYRRSYANKRSKFPFPANDARYQQPPLLGFSLYIYIYIYTQTQKLPSTFPAPFCHVIILFSFRSGRPGVDPESLLDAVPHVAFNIVSGRLFFGLTVVFTYTYKTSPPVVASDQSGVLPFDIIQYAHKSPRIKNI